MLKSIMAWAGMGYGVYALLSYGPGGAIIAIAMFLFASNMLTEVRVDKLEEKLKEVTGESD